MRVHMQEGINIRSYGDRRDALGIANEVKIELNENKTIILHRLDVERIFMDMFADLDNDSPCNDCDRSGDGEVAECPCDEVKAYPEVDEVFVTISLRKKGVEVMKRMINNCREPYEDYRKVEEAK